MIDTPGLGDLKIPIETILKEMKQVVSDHEDYTLIYCISVAPNTILEVRDKVIIQNLNRALGKEVWNKCVLLLTFSDYARLEFDDSEEDYIEHIKSHAYEFQELLKTIGVNIPSIVTVFDQQFQNDDDRGEFQDRIIAIPVNKKPEKSEEILPGILKENQVWTDIAFAEILKKASPEHWCLVMIRYADFVRAGINYGVRIGFIAGIIGGPIGVAVGAILGSFLSGTAGGVTAFLFKKL